MLDCCHSGTGTDLPFLLEHRAQHCSCDDNPSHSAGDVLCLSGCEDHQTSADASDRYQQPAGALTSALTDVMEVYGAAGSMSCGQLLERERPGTAESCVVPRAEGVRGAAHDSDGLVLLRT